MSKSKSPEIKFETFVFCGFSVSGHLSLNPKLLELHLLALQRGDVLALPTQGIPRVTNKLTLCFNPNLPVISTTVTSKTGLVSSILEDQAAFDEDTVTILKCFIRRLQQPACLVAYDGDFTGFRVLRNEFNKLHVHIDDDIYCASIRRALRTFLPRYDSYNLQNVYKILYEEEADILGAEDIVSKIVAIVTKILPCVSWIDCNSVLLNAL